MSDRYDAAAGSAAMRMVPLRLHELRESLRRDGAKPCHERGVLRAWTHARPLDSGTRRADEFLPARLRRALPAFGDALARLAGVRSTHDSVDGSTRLLVELHDGQAVESVLLPGYGLCVSTQVG